MDGTSAPLPGWYQDPWDAGRRRDWDGQTWTGHVYAGPGTPEAPLWPASSYAAVAVAEAEPATAPPYELIEPPPSIPPPPPPAPEPEKRSALARWAPMLLVLAVVLGLAGGI